MPLASFRLDAGLVTAVSLPLLKDLKIAILHMDAMIATTAVSIHTQGIRQTGRCHAPSFLTFFYLKCRLGIM